MQREPAEARASTPAATADEAEAVATDEDTAKPDKPKRSRKSAKATESTDGDAPA
jgi:hypothetical protein